MKSETFIGALIAAVIGFLTAFLALFQQEGVATVSDISEGAWVVLVVGTLLVFFKDMQALSVRRTLTKVTGTGNTYLLPFVAVLAIGASLAGCGVQHPKVDSLSDAIVVAAADVETAAGEVQALCGNTAPGGPCAHGSLISTSQKETAKASLQQAQDVIVAANRALVAGDSIDAKNKLDRAASILLIVQGFIEERIE